MDVHLLDDQGPQVTSFNAMLAMQRSKQRRERAGILQAKLNAVAYHFNVDPKYLHVDPVNRRIIVTEEALIITDRPWLR